MQEGSACEHSDELAKTEPTAGGREILWCPYEGIPDRGEHSEGVRDPICNLG